MEVSTVSKVSLDQDETETLYRLVESLDINSRPRFLVETDNWDFEICQGFSVSVLDMMRPQLNSTLHIITS
jgi:hypothetical protein